MIVYSSIIKIFKKSIPFILIYLGMSIVFSLIFLSNNSETTKTYEVYIINEDEDSLLIKGLTEYLDEVVNLVNFEGNYEDGLFYGSLDFVLIINKNFSNDFYNNKETYLDMYSNNAYVVESLVNNYLNAARIYNSNGISVETYYEYLKIDLNQDVNKIYLSEENKSLLQLNYFLNFLNYILLVVCISVTSNMLASFNLETIRKRNKVSSFKLSKLSLELILGIMSFLLVIYFIYVFLIFILFSEAISKTLVYMLLNLFIFLIFISSFAYFIGSFNLKTEARSGIVNLVALGSSFICGAFVPMELLGKGVVTFSKILPSYYFIKNNNDLASFGFSTDIIIRYIILLCFSFLFFILAFIVSYNKKGE